MNVMGLIAAFCAAVAGVFLLALFAVLGIAAVIGAQTLLSSVPA